MFLGLKLNIKNIVGNKIKNSPNHSPTFSMYKKFARLTPSKKCISLKKNVSPKICNKPVRRSLFGPDSDKSTINLANILLPKNKHNLDEYKGLNIFKMFYYVYGSWYNVVLGITNIFIYILYVLTTISILLLYL